MAVNILTTEEEIIAQCNAAVFRQNDLSAWRNSKYIAFRQCTNGKRRGTWGEQYFALMMQAYGCSVEKAASTEYDRLVQGTKCEVKTCCSDYSDGTHMHVSFEQIRVYQDYDMLIGQVVTPKCVRLFAIPHSVTLGWAQNGTIKNQHGGIHANSGAYILNHSVLPEWLAPFETSYEALAGVLCS